MHPCSIIKDPDSSSSPSSEGYYSGHECGTRGGRGSVRHGVREGPKSSKGRRVCYAVPDQTELETSDAIIKGTVHLYHHSTLVLFGPDSTYLYASPCFYLDLDIICEPFAEPICVFTPVGESLMVNHVYQGCIATFLGRNTITDLILLHMVDIYMIFDID